MKKQRINQFLLIIAIILGLLCNGIYYFNLYRLALLAFIVISGAFLLAVALSIAQT